MRSYELCFLVLALGIPWAFLRSFIFSESTSAAENSTSPSHAIRNSLIVALVSLPLLLLVSSRVLDRFPNSADEYATLYEAETFSRGQLYNSPSPDPDFFFFKYIIEKDGKRCGMYPPGFPSLLAVFFISGIPVWMVNPLIGALTLALYWYFTREIIGERLGFLAVGALAASSFFLFQSASFFSHQWCSFLILAALFCVRRSFTRYSLLTTIFAGVFFGIAFTTRYYTALLCALPVGIALLLRADEYRIRRIFWLCIGGLPFFFLQLWYNSQITGEMFLFPHTWANSDERIGFYRGHTIWTGLRLAKEQLSDLQEWSLPSLMLLFVMRFGLQRRKLDYLDWIFPVVVFGYVFWWSDGVNRYGPRYYYEAFPFLLLSAFRFIRDSDHGRAFQNYAKGLLELGYVGAIWFLFLHVQKEHQIVYERQDLYRQVTQQQIENTVVFLAAGTGAIRLMPEQDLTRNGIDLNPSVLYVFDLGERNTKILELYPNRRYVRYSRERKNPKGNLQEFVPEPSKPKPSEHNDT